MAKDYKEIFNKLIADMKLKKSLGIEKVEKAFKLAEKLHAGQKRKSGEEYILHPVEVALTLEQHDFDSNVISAGLRHDVVEDCGYTVEEIKHEFNTEVANIVDAVSAITAKSLKGEAAELLKQDEFAKFDLKEMSYQKLISLGKVNKYAFYIKFADRLNNLRTIACFPRYKQVEKVRETLRWILPILKMFRAYKFYNEIANECFTILNEDELEKFNIIYDAYFSFNKKIYSEVKENILIALNEQLLKLKKPTENTQVKLRTCTKLEVVNMISDTLDIKEVKNIKQSQFNKVPITKLYIIFNNAISTKEARNIFFGLLEGDLKDTIKIIDYQKNELFNFNYLVVQDKFRNKYQLKVFNFADYVTFRNGSTDGTDIELVDEQASEIVTKYIKVKTRSGEEIYMPEGSTVLDFAFKIHRDFGFSVKYAFLNGSPSKSPIYTRLAEGDQINLEIAKSEDGLVKNIAELRWITYCKTDSAQKALIRYFEKLI
mgnify:FL=1